MKPGTCPAPTKPGTGTGNADADAVALLRELVEIPSLSGSEGVLAAHLALRMESLGLRAEIDEAGNVIGSRGPADAPHVIVLLGHMDTVPGHIPVRIEGDVLYGRGSVDAKGPLATFVAGAARAALPPGVRLDVIGAVEEESATSRGARHAARRPAPAACIIGEPSAWDGITLGYKGRLLVDGVWRQPSAHSAGPGQTAADRAVEWWSYVLRWVGERNQGIERVFDQVQAGVRSMQTFSDGLEDRAELTAGFRLPPDCAPGDIESVCCAGPGGGELVARGAERAHVADRSNAVVRALGGAIRRAGAKPSLRVKTGTSDMNVVGPAWNCPIAAYGPGDSALDHTPDEHLSLSEYLASCGVLRDAIEHLAAELSGP